MFDNIEVYFKGIGLDVDWFCLAWSSNRLGVFVNGVMNF
jgi:hypothetical protein